MPSMSMPQQLPPVKQEPYIKTEPLSQLPSVSQPYHPQPSFYSQQQQESQAKGELTPLPNVSQPYHPPPPFCQQQQQQQGSSYSSNHQYGQQSHQSYSSPSSSSSSNGPMASFSNLASSGNYNLSRHIMAMNMHQNPAVSSASTAVPSGTTTPVVPNTHLNTSAFSSAPSSPTLNNMQYHPNGGNSHLNSNVNSNVNSNSNSGSNSPYVQHQSYAYQSQQQQQQQHSYSHQTSHSSDLNSNNYYNSSPPYASQQQQQQQQQPQQSQPHHGGANVGGNAAHVQFSSTAPSPMRQHQQSQYAALVPPLSDSQYAQYRQLLGSSAFSSTQSTPYHSNHSTPYSSMPGSPTHEYQQLNEAQLSQKPKRRQVKNACGKSCSFVLLES
ncbi:hypothetical protein BC939DRAFT_315698 [Gamsiella multidivaricata]|uniref:uncharacterized protein n=1 Tax=Gamsiella multidivaricata TaxID=101098 RepID=UPI002221161F|nr:uncharacterized protein BC939DRAFT_315698 [Gamsiella multidivaricata]KAI7817754.1 hypothetical protein BC939DRAFT_315698 [Gamsiella multidivaricata]